MGTRNLTMVISNGETKVAQYGQWDGYPGGQGSTALEFLRKMDANKFREKVGNLRWITKEEATALDETDWTKTHPFLSRDTGANILNTIYYDSMEIRDPDANVFSGKKIDFPCKVEFLQDESNFAADSLFCEWAYVIDLDKNTFEVYEGFNKSPLDENDRFYHLEKTREDSEYYPIRLSKSYDLNNLPDVETFINDFKEEDED
jgi:hypothetical protein